MPEILSFIQNSPADQSVLGLLTIFFLGTFVSEDATCLAAGAAVATGRINFGLAVTACLAGIFIGDILLYGVGRLIGTALFTNRFVSVLVSISSRDKATGWLQKNAASAVFFSRFVSGLRLPTYLAAGALRTNFAKFAVLFLIASSIWTPILVGSAAFAQHFIFHGSTIIGIVALLLAIRIILKFSSWKNRRLLVGRIRRIVKWEFWPLPIFYLPVVFYVLVLSIRFRSLTVFTAANPGIAAGGFVGESKDDIYKLIESSQVTKKHLLRHEKIDASYSLTERLLLAIRFIRRNDLDFPVVLKPDLGERGTDVQIIRDKMGLGLAIKNSAGSGMILQEFCPGVEASIFYYRFPESHVRQIFSITEKNFPAVVGDGKSTVEELILADKRAVSMAKKYFARQLERLSYVPSEGETVSLIDIGTHSMGAIFRDGEWLRTAKLERAIDMVCRGIDGFYFGRFDVRAASFDELRAGKFKIIELNGVTSESTNIYDPKFSLVDAYRILFEQWKLAFTIGEANCKRGVKPLSVRQLIRLITTRDAAFLSAARPNDKISSIPVSKACA